MSPEPETEVVSCPACRHLLRVPLDLLGQPVQCPECRAMFRAPVRDGRGGLTAAELISRVPSAGPGGGRKRADPMLLLPAFGLMLCGVVGVIVNGMLGYKFLSDPAGSKQYVRDQMAVLRQYGVAAEGDENAAGELADRVAAAMRWVLPAFGVVSAVVFLGGLSVVLRWNRRVAQVACVLAALNVPHGCCVPGAAAGVWGLLMLGSDEARDHFAR